MNIQEAAVAILKQLHSILDQVHPDDYKITIPNVDGTIGEHTRHIIEFYFCLMNGLENKVVNYDNRKRERQIETDPVVASRKIDEIIASIMEIEENTSLSLKMTYDYSDIDDLKVQSNYHRELAYNIEHAIHHMALIKIAIRKQCKYIVLPEHFGIASSTIRHSRTMG